MNRMLDGMHGSILIILDRDRANSNFRGVGLDIEPLIEVRVSENKEWDNGFFQLAEGLTHLVITLEGPLPSQSRGVERGADHC